MIGHDHREERNVSKYFSFPRMRNTLKLTVHSFTGHDVAAQVQRDIPDEYRRAFLGGRVENENTGGHQYQPRLKGTSKQARTGSQSQQPRSFMPQKVAANAFATKTHSKFPSFNVVVLFRGGTPANGTEVIPSTASIFPITRDSVVGEKNK